MRVKNQSESFSHARYHKIGRKGKLETAPTKQMGSKEDLSVAYSPGVAEPCLSIKKDEKYVFEYTAKSHLGMYGNERCSGMNVKFSKSFIYF